MFRLEVRVSISDGTADDAIVEPNGALVMEKVKESTQFTVVLIGSKVFA